MANFHRLCMRATLALCMLCQVCPLNIVAQDSATTRKPRELWRDAYTILRRAELAREKGDADSARFLLGRARDGFEEVLRLYPTWNPSLLSYRVNYCNQQIDEVRRGVPLPAKPARTIPVIPARRVAERDTTPALAPAAIPVPSGGLGGTGTGRPVRPVPAALAGTGTDDTRQRLTTTARKLNRLRYEKSQVDAALEAFGRSYGQIKKMHQQALVANQRLARRSEQLQMTLTKQASLLQQKSEELESMEDTRSVAAGLKKALEEQSQQTATAEGESRRLATRIGELESAHAGAKELETEAKRLQAELQRQAEETASASQRVALLEKERAPLVEETKHLRAQASQLSAELRVLEANSARVTGALQERATTAEDRLSTLENGTNSLREELNLSRKSLAYSRQVAEDGARALRDRERELKETKRENDALTRASEERATLLENVQRDMKTATGDLRRGIGEGKELKAQLKDRDTILAKTTSKLEEIGGENSTLKRSLASAERSLRQQEEQQEDLAEELRRSEKAAASLEEELTELRREQKTSATRGKETAKALRKRAGEMNRLKEELDDLAQGRDKRLEAARKDLLETQNKAAKAATQNEKVVAGLKEELTELTKERKGFVAREKGTAKAFRERDAEITRLEGAVVALAQEKTNLMVASRKEVLEAENKSGKEAVRIVEERDRLAGTLETTQAANREAIQATRKEIASLTKGNKSLQSESTALKRAVRDADAKLARSQAKLTAAEGEAKLRIAEMQKSNTNVSAELASAKRDGAAMQRQLEDFQGQAEKLTRAQADLKTSEADLDKLKGETKTLASQLRVLRDERAKLTDSQSRLKTIDAERQGLAESVREQAKLIAAKDARLLELEAIRTELEEAGKHKSEQLLEYIATSRQRREEDVISKEAELNRQARLESLLKQASEAEKDGDRKTAADCYRKVNELDGDNRLAGTRAGLLYAQLEMDDEAISLLSQALGRYPEDTTVILPLSMAVMRQSKAHMAVAVLSQGVSREPKNATFRRFLGVACNEAGWRNAAEMELRESFKLDGTSAETAYNIAVVLASGQTPNIEEARQWYQKAKQLGAKPDASLEKLLK